jgi:putative tributyrin esterase
MKARFRSALLFGLLFCIPAFGQPSRAETALPISSPRLSTEEVDSKLVGRKMPYRIVVPVSYSTREESGRRYPVLYLLHGLTGHFDNWTQRTELINYSAAYKLIIVTPEGENSWYTDNLTKDGDKFESYIIKELIPQIDKRYRTIDQRNHRAIAGLSMGGFGAIKFGLKYPDLFALVGSFSGAIGAATINEKEVPGAIGRSINQIFGPFGGEVRKANDPFDILRRATPEKIKKYPFIYLDCGTEDFLFQNNRDFVSLLLEKKVPHEFRQLPGGHNWTYWDAQVEEFLELTSEHIGAARHPVTN